MDLSISRRRHWNDPKTLQKPLLAELGRNHCRPLAWHKSNKGAWLSTKFMNLWCRSRGECVLVVSPYANFWPIHTGGRLVVWDRKSHCEPRWWKQEKVVLFLTKWSVMELIVLRGYRLHYCFFSFSTLSTNVLEEMWGLLFTCATALSWHDVPGR